jgi:hypothetical protein
MPSLIAALARAFRTPDPVEYRGVLLKRAWDHIEQGYEVYVGDVGYVWRGLTTSGDPYYAVTVYSQGERPVRYVDTLPKVVELLPM